jgi:hypothetical protein
MLLNTCRKEESISQSHLRYAMHRSVLYEETVPRIAISWMCSVYVGADNNDVTTIRFNTRSSSWRKYVDRRVGVAEWAYICSLSLNVSNDSVQQFGYY